MKGVGLKVEASRRVVVWMFSPRPRVRVDLIGQDCESEISNILLMWALGIGASQHAIITFMCMVTSRRVECGCTVWSFTTLGKYGLSLSLGLRPMKTHSSNLEIRSN